MGAFITWGHVLRLTTFHGSNVMFRVSTGMSGYDTEAKVEAMDMNSCFRAASCIFDVLAKSQNI